MSAEKISFIDLVVFFFFVGNAQVAVTENRYQSDLTGLFVDACQHFYIRQRPFSKISVAGVYSEYCNRPVSIITEMMIERKTGDKDNNQEKDFSHFFLFSAFFMRSFVSRTILSHTVLLTPPFCCIPVLWIWISHFALFDGAVQFFLQCIFIGVIILQIQFFNLVRT